MAYNYTMNLTQALAVVAKIDPASQTAGTYTTGAIDVSKYRRIVATVSVGTMGSGGTVDFKFQGCATSGGSYADIDSTNCKIAQVQQAASGSSTVSELEMRMEYINSLGYRYIKGLLTVGTATSPVGVVVKGSVARYDPASLGNASGVVAPVVY